MRISDWSSDVCSSDLAFVAKRGPRYDNHDPRGWLAKQGDPHARRANAAHLNAFEAFAPFAAGVLMEQAAGVDPTLVATQALISTDEHTSELLSLMRVSYAVFCSDHKNNPPPNHSHTQHTQQHDTTKKQRFNQPNQMH